MKIQHNEEGTAYITEANKETRVFALELDNDEGWALERQLIDGDENPERLSCHESEDDALAELALYGSVNGDQ